MGMACVSRFGIGGENEDFDGGGGAFLDALNGVHAVEERHGEVEDDDVGDEFVSEDNGLLAIGGFADDFDVRFGSEEGAEALPDDGVIIGDENSDHNQNMGGF